MRWRMCPRCGIKMQHTVDEEEVDIFICPVCKDGDLIISGDLFEQVQKIADTKNQTANEVLLEALKEIKDWSKENERKNNR